MTIVGIVRVLCTASRLHREARFLPGKAKRTSEASRLRLSGNTERYTVLYVNYSTTASMLYVERTHTHENIYLKEAFRSWSGSPWTVGPGMMTGGPVQLWHNPAWALSV